MDSISEYRLEEVLRDRVAPASCRCKHGLEARAASLSVRDAAEKMPPHEKSHFVSRGGDKLDAALDHFGLEVAGLVCADFGSNVGGFVDCLLQRGAARVYAVDTSYGTLAWKLRKDPRVVVRERSNAMHVTLPERVSLVTIDAAWTRQSRVLPNALAQLAPGGWILTLIKPHYEAPPGSLVDGVLPDDQVSEVVNRTLASMASTIASAELATVGTFASPLRGQAGNCEVFALLRRAPA